MALAKSQPKQKPIALGDTSAHSARHLQVAVVVSPAATSSHDPAVCV